MNVNDVKRISSELEENIGKVIKGKEDTIHMLVAALLSGGNVLLEDVPGSGKTMLAKTLAASVGGDFTRIQMTPDYCRQILPVLIFLMPRHQNLSLSEALYLPIFFWQMKLTELHRRHSRVFLRVWKKSRLP